MPRFLSPQHTRRASLAVEAGASRVAGNAKLQQDNVRPAIALGLDVGAVLGAEEREALAQHRVAVCKYVGQRREVGVSVACQQRTASSSAALARTGV